RGRRVSRLARAQAQGRGGLGEMSASRERILARARAATESLPERASPPDDAAFSAARSRLAPPSGNLDTLASAFGARWEEVGGVLLESRIALETFLEMRG